MEIALAKFVNAAQAMLDKYMSQNFPNLGRQVLRVEKGRKYARIVAQYENGMLHNQGRSVYCFVDLQSGDVLKAASWKTPAKHARGNIFAPNPIAGVNPHGANYLT